MGDGEPATSTLDHQPITHLSSQFPVPVPTQIGFLPTSSDSQSSISINWFAVINQIVIANPVTVQG